VTAIESNHRKANFVAAAATRLGLANLTVIPRQAREVGRFPDHAGAYDAVVLRAVGDPGRLVRDCRQLLRPTPGSRIVFYQTPETVAETQPLAQREAAKYGLTVAESAVVELPLAAGRRQFLILTRSAGSGAPQSSSLT